MASRPRATRRGGWRNGLSESWHSVTPATKRCPNHDGKTPPDRQDGQLFPVLTVVGSARPYTRASCGQGPTLGSELPVTATHPRGTCTLFQPRSESSFLSALLWGGLPDRGVPPTWPIARDVTPGLEGSQAQVCAKSREICSTKRNSIHGASASRPLGAPGESPQCHFLSTLVKNGPLTLKVGPLILNEDVWEVPGVYERRG